MIYKKLLAIQTKSIALKKDQTNPFFKSKYITLDNIIETYNPILNELKIVCYHYAKDNKIITCLYDTEDETKVESEFNIYTNDPQKQGSEITYWKRYNLGQLLNIQTDDDDDWNKASSWWNTKQFYDDDLSWIADDNINNLKTLIWEWKSFTLRDIRKKYKISKVNQEKLKNIWII